jgi:polyhydroxybutyrate depolymerase
MKKIIYTVIFLLLVVPGIAQSKQIKGAITVDGMERTFVTYVPVINDINYKPAVVISLHGGFGDGKQMMEYADFKPVADQEKFIIVCPDGIRKSWNDGRALITYMIKTYHADATKVYVTGMSNGGFMASRLACEIPQRIAAIAVVGASMDRYVDYEPKHPMPVMYIQGTADPLVPFGGGDITMGAKGIVYSHKQVLEKWITVDSCNTSPVVTTLPDNAHDGTTLTKEEYSNSNGLKVISYTINNGGHVWPDSKRNLPRFITGRPCNNLNTCRVIWDFFKNYSNANAAN